MRISIQQSENSVERVDNSVIINLYNAHINDNISDEVNENNQNIGLVGSITADGGYESQVSTLNSAYPKFHCTVTKTYLEFRDPNVYAVLRNYGLGDSFGIAISDLNGVKLHDSQGLSFKNNTDIEYFEEFKYFTNNTDGNGGPFYGCTNLKLIALPETLYVGGDGFFTNVHCDTIVPSVKWLMEFNCGRRDCLPSLNNQYNYYVGDINHKLLDLVVTSNINVPQTNVLSSRFAGSGLKTITWESSSNIPEGVFKDCNTITTLTVTGNITSIGREAFRLSSALTSVTLPQSCTTLAKQAFYNCSSLQTFTASGLTSISDTCFQGCTSLTTFDFSNVTNLDENAFRGCSSLGVGQTLELNLTEQNKYPHFLLGGTKYTRLILHSPQQQQGTYDGRYPVYESMNQLQYLDLSDWRPAKDSNNYYGDCSFYNNNSLVTYIGPITTTYISTSIARLGTYSNFRYFILLPTTPPILKTDDNNNPTSRWFYNKSGNVHIYVPDSAKAAYLADTDWASIGGYNGSDTIVDRLHGLSELPAGVWTTGLASQYLTPAQLATS